MDKGAHTAERATLLMFYQEGIRNERAREELQLPRAQRLDYTM